MLKALNEKLVAVFRRRGIFIRMILIIPILFLDILNDPRKRVPFFYSVVRFFILVGVPCVLLTLIFRTLIPVTDRLELIVKMIFDTDKIGVPLWVLTYGGYGIFSVFSMSFIKKKLIPENLEDLVGPRLRYVYYFLLIDKPIIYFNYARVIITILLYFLTLNWMFVSFKESYLISAIEWLINQA